MIPPRLLIGSHDLLLNSFHKKNKTVRIFSLTYRLVHLCQQGRASSFFFYISLASLLLFLFWLLFPLTVNSSVCYFCPWWLWKFHVITVSVFPKFFPTHQVTIDNASAGHNNTDCGRWEWRRNKKSLSLLDRLLRQAARPRTTRKLRKGGNYAEAYLQDCSKYINRRNRFWRNTFGQYP